MEVGAIVEESVLKELVLHAEAEKEHNTTISSYQGKWEGNSKVDGANTMRRIYIETLTTAAKDGKLTPAPGNIASILVTWDDKMKIATAEYEHSALKLVTPKAAGAGVTVQVGDKAEATTITIKPPTADNPEALYAANTTATAALLISDIKADKVLHIFSGTLSVAANEVAANATTFTIPEKEVPQAEVEAGKTTFAELIKTSLATDFKWIGK